MGEEVQAHPKLPSQTSPSKLHGNQQENRKLSGNTSQANNRSLPAINTGESLEEKESSKAVGGNAHWQQPVEWAVSKCLRNYEVRTSLGSDIPENTID